MQENNNFVMDRPGTRYLRFNNLSDFIVEYSAILELPENLVNWAINAKSEYESASSALLNAKLDYKNARWESDSADKLLQEIYQKCKLILVSQFNKDKKMVLLGIEGKSPTNHNNLVSAADTMLKGIADLISQGYTDIIPESFRSALEEKLQASIQNFFQIGVMEEKYSRAKQIFKEKFDSDSKNLRILYSYIISQKGKTYPFLPVLGFAIDNKKRGRKRKSRNNYSEEEPVQP